MFEKLLVFCGANKDLKPELEEIPLTQKQNRFQYVGGHLLKISFGKGRSLIPADLYRLFYEGNY